MKCFNPSSKYMGISTENFACGYWGLEKKSKKKARNDFKSEIWEVTHHQYGTSVLVAQTSFHVETRGGVAKCWWLFSPARFIGAWLKLRKIFIIFRWRRYILTWTSSYQENVDLETTLILVHICYESLIKWNILDGKLEKYRNKPLYWYLPQNGSCDNRHWWRDNLRA